MTPYSPFYSLELLYMLVTTCAAIGIFIFNMAMLSEMRRKRLKLVSQWLVPAIIASGVLIFYHIFSDLRMLIGLRMSVFVQLVPIVAGTASAVLSVLASFGLWKMLQQMPNNTPANLPQTVTSSPDTWPPPPKSPS